MSTENDDLKAVLGEIGDILATETSVEKASVVVPKKEKKIERTEFRVFFVAAKSAYKDTRGKNMVIFRDYAHSPSIVDRGFAMEAHLNNFNEAIRPLRSLKPFSPELSESDRIKQAELLGTIWGHFLAGLVYGILFDTSSYNQTITEKVFHRQSSEVEIAHMNEIYSKGLPGTIENGYLISTKQIRDKLKSVGRPVKSSSITHRLQVFLRVLKKNKQPNLKIQAPVIMKIAEILDE